MTKNFTHPVRTLSVSALSCSRGGRDVLENVALSVAPGEALMLTGPNGVGKSTLLMCLAGLLHFDGQVTWQGRDEEERPGSDLHFLSHLPALKRHLSLRDNLAFWASLNGGDRDLIGPALAEARLDHAADLDAALLSAGQTRRLAICRLLVARRPIWLMDEPTAALDSQGDAWVARLIDTHLQAGGLAVIATHLPLAVTGKTKSLKLGAEL